MIDKLKNMMRDVSFSKTNGRMVSDKSYAYDTIFFIGNYIKLNLKNLPSGEKYITIAEQRENAKIYAQEVFKLNPLSDGAQNYFFETMNLLVFSNVFAEKRSAQKNALLCFKRRRNF